MARISGGAVAARVWKMQMDRGATADWARNWSTTTIQRWGMYSERLYRPPKSGDADPGHDERLLGGAPEEPVARPRTPRAARGTTTGR